MTNENNRESDSSTPLASYGPGSAAPSADQTGATPGGQAGFVPPPPPPPPAPPVSRVEEEEKKQPVELVGGILILVLGVVFLISNLGLFHIGNIWRFWPVVLLAVAANRIFKRKPWGGTVALLIIGGVFLVYNLGLMDWSPFAFWPLALVAVGVSMLIKAFHDNRRR